MPQQLLAPLRPTPDIAPTVSRARKLLILAADKAVANSINPAAYPIARNSLEDIMARRFREVPPSRRDLRQAVAREKERRRATARADWKRRYSRAALPRRNLLFQHLASVDLRTRVPLHAQLQRGYFVQPSERAFEKLAVLANAQLPLSQKIAANQWLSQLIPTAQEQPPASAKSTLEFLIKDVVCVDETGRLLGEVGADEIYLGGHKIGPTGQVIEIPSFKVADFEEDGVIHNYTPPKLFADFSLAGSDWPKSFIVTMVLAERDGGGFGEFLSDLADRVRTSLAEDVAATMGLPFAGVTAGILSTVIGLVAVFAIVELVDYIKKAWEDDVFPPVPLGFTIPSAAAANFDNVATGSWWPADFVAHNGKYFVNYSTRCV